MIRSLRLNPSLELEINHWEHGNTGKSKGNSEAIDIYLILPRAPMFPVVFPTQRVANEENAVDK
jgi:hypothetical protein